MHSLDIYSIKAIKSIEQVITQLSSFVADMVRTKQTARGSSAPRPGGMATAKFAGRGRGDPEAQFADDPFDIADEDLPNVLEDADKPKGGEPSTSKSVGKEGEAQTKGQAAEGHRLLLKEYRQHKSQSPPPHYQVQAQAPLRTPPMNQPKTPPKPQAR